MIRKLVKNDLGAIKKTIDSSELFPSTMMDAMTANYFNNPSSPEIWLTHTEGDTPVAVAFCAPEQMAVGTFNLYLIAVHDSHQGKGIGQALMGRVEAMLMERKGRVLIVETSALPDFARTRKFYEQLGYHREAVIREFYQKGEDKVIFWKKLERVNDA